MAGRVYRFTGYRKFLDPDGYPAVTPPWGTLNAIDLNTGRYLWKIPLGEYPELADKSTGSENYGGPILTASGLLFIGATLYDKKIRAFDSRTGGLLWQDTLPFAGNATPITYMAKGRQYVLIQTDNARDKKRRRARPMSPMPCPDIGDQGSRPSARAGLVLDMRSMSATAIPSFCIAVMKSRKPCGSSG